MALSGSPKHLFTNMSRSLHTQKLDLRAQRRLARPHSKRREEAGYLSGRNGTALASTLARLLIETKKCLPGMLHPLTIREVRAFLAILGPASIYGLRAIRFRRESAVRAKGIVFAEYLMPGELQVFATPASPWRLPFMLADAHRLVLERYCARVHTGTEKVHTTANCCVNHLKRIFIMVAM